VGSINGLDMKARGRNNTFLGAGEEREEEGGGGNVI
jgi:hypothetical protein